MPKRTQCKCLCCKEDFLPNVRNRDRQKYCAKPACQRASKAASQRRWLQKPENRYYFKGEHNAARARQWQRQHPGYGKRTARAKRRTLQETLPRKPLIQGTNNASKASPVAPLQEALHAQEPLLIGLIATLADSTLQKDIAAASQRLLQLGHDILAATQRVFYGWGTRYAEYRNSSEASIIR